jgi:hypothetical protein
MKIKQWFVVTTLTIAVGAALASQPDGNAPLARAEVRQSVLAARAAGGLLPAGDAADYPRDQASASSTLTRGEVRHEVIEARAAGELIPAGDADEEAVDRAELSARSSLTRGDVKAATLRARDAGELVPAGDADDGSVAREVAQDKYARAAWLAHKSTTATSVGG